MSGDTYEDVTHQLSTSLVKCLVYPKIPQERNNVSHEILKTGHV